ncbi:MAG: hypothetical protein PVI06_13130 [Desulfobacterales bacterium]|jgi:hypothetical protein
MLQKFWSHSNKYKLQITKTINIQISKAKSIVNVDFLQDKLIASVILTAGERLSLGKANCGVGSRDSTRCRQQGAKYKVVAVGRHGRP